LGDTVNYWIGHFFGERLIANPKVPIKKEHIDKTKAFFEKQEIADKEPESISLFGQLIKVEEKHEERYIIIAKKLDSKTLYDSDTEWEWKCINCGYIYKGQRPPETCPVCQKPFTWYMPLGLVR
ncbi:hypothetical protein KKE75_02125, partial [Patescibacteria group bacterium]|nr:hypothetical protein [Patescibacteria group bacterium]